MVGVRYWVGMRGPQVGAGPVVIFDEGVHPVPLAADFPTPPGLGRDQWDWGVPSKGATRLAWCILAASFGDEIAGCLAVDFSKEWLARQSRRGFFIGRRTLERWLTEWVVAHAGEFTRKPGKGGNGVVPF